MTGDQREQWRRALAVKAARNRRHGPHARGMRIIGGRAVTGAGMLRIQPAERHDTDLPAPGGAAQGGTT